MFFQAAVLKETDELSGSVKAIRPWALSRSFDRSRARPAEKKEKSFPLESL